VKAGVGVNAAQPQNLFQQCARQTREALLTPVYNSARELPQQSNGDSSARRPGETMLSLRRYLPLLATLLVIAVNAAANIVPLNGYNTGELSALNPTGFTPAGWVFSIWSLIYLGLLAFSIASVVGAERFRLRAAPIVNAYLLNAAANIGWIFAWHYRHVELSFALMLVILVTLIVIVGRLRDRPSPSWREFLTMDGPFSLYFGWITTATLANLGAVFFVQQYYPFSLNMDQWALITVCAATAIYVWMGVVTRDTVYCAVFVWAALGIAYRPTGITESVKLAAWAGAVAMVLCILWVAIGARGGTSVWLRNRRSARSASELDF